MMITTQTNHELEDHMALISQMYPGVYTQVSTQQGESSKPRRRRRKNKGGENSLTGAKKRKLSEGQVNLLELNFGNEHKLESERKDRIASEVGLDPRQVAVWFQNRRARWKTKKLEEEFSKLKTVHDGVLLEKRRLESEVQKLKERLCEADKEIQRLTERADGVSGNSTPSSSLSMEAAMNPPFLGEFVVEGYEDVPYIGGNNSFIQGMEWMNLYQYM